MPQHPPFPKKLPPLRLKNILIVLFLLVGLLPLCLSGLVATNSFRQSLLDTHKAEVQERSGILSTKLTRTGYLHNQDKKDNSLNSELEIIAQSYHGRILVVDQNYRIIEDSFHLAEGRYHIAPEVIRSFRGENATNYNADKYYMVQTTPIYDSLDVKAEDRVVEGVLLFISSTELQRTELQGVSETLRIFTVAVGLLLALISVILASLILRPFAELRAALRKVSVGNLNETVEQNSYLVTAQISEDVNATLRKLRALNESRQEFVSNVSHELKTPITSMRVLADSLISAGDAPLELYKEFMTDISKEIDREAKIIDDLLSLVRMDRSGTVLNRKETDMHEMLEQILKRLRPLAKVNQIELTLHTVREVTAEVDEVKFSLAIMNLVENGIKYNGNQKDGYVQVTLDADHQFCYIRVEDNGIGIPEDQQELVFERFHRVDKARSRETGGTGLGLAITKEIILLHQGMIRLTSEVGKGSTFQVRIPLKYIESSTPAQAASQKKRRRERGKRGEARGE